MTVYQLIVMMIAGLITVLPLCAIAKKAGFKGDWWVALLLILIPFLQLIYLYMIAFKKWDKN